MGERFTLYGRVGWGSAIVEAQLVFYGLDYDFVTIGHLFKDPAARDELAKLNPLSQIPTFILPNGEVMTESGAITLFLADHTGRDDLVPGPGAAERAAFLRWMIYTTSNIYPTYTYADDPARFVPDADAREGFKDTVFAYGEKLYRILDQAAGTPWFLGDRLSAIALYLGILTWWEPGWAWFEREAPALRRIAETVRARPGLAAVYKRNSPAAAIAAG